MKIKLCGFKEEDSLKTAIDCKVDFIGFIFHEDSPRNVNIDSAQKLAKLIPSEISKVAVTVNAPIKKLQEIYNAIKPEYFQLHGLETLEEIQEIKEKFPRVKLIKAISITNEKDLGQISKYEKNVDNILLDNKIPGSGQSFDWDLICDLKTKNDFILSGGLNKNNLIDAITKTNAKMVDISSGIEENRGEKSSKLIKEITAILKNTN